MSTGQTDPSTKAKKAKKTAQEEFSLGNIDFPDLCRIVDGLKTAPSCYHTIDGHTHSYSFRKKPDGTFCIAREERKVHEMFVLRDASSLTEFQEGNYYEIVQKEGEYVLLKNDFGEERRLLVTRGIFVFVKDELCQG